MTIKTRFAPSPSGYLHIGNIRTALLNYLYAKQNKGRFILRIDDTNDSDPRMIRNIKHDLQSLGLEWDHSTWTYIDDDGVHYQSKNRFQHDIMIDLIVGSGESYYDENNMLRMKKFPDNALTKSDGTPLYNLACVADDFDLKITHVIRGDDHISNTHLQKHIFKAIGEKPPEYIHHSQIIGPNNEKISKRDGKNSYTISDYGYRGIHKWPLLSYLARAGTPNDPILYTSMEQMICHFNIEDFVGRSKITVDDNVIKNLNTQYVRNMSWQEVEHRSNGLYHIRDDLKEEFWELFKNNVETCEELQKWVSVCMEMMRGKINNDYWGMINANNGKVDQWLRQRITGLNHGPDLHRLLRFIERI